MQYYGGQYVGAYGYEDPYYNEYYGQEGAYPDPYYQEQAY
jgi:hypothetical protein